MNTKACTCVYPPDYDIALCDFCRARNLAKKLEKEHTEKGGNQMATDTKTMSPRELVRGLMRGDKRVLKRGYSATNAAMAVRDRQQLDDAEFERLRAYAKGFFDGMILVIGEVSMALEGQDDKALNAFYQEGVHAGLGEDPDLIQPTPEAQA